MVKYAEHPARPAKGGGKAETLPCMVEFVASIARYQLKHRRYFIIENPQICRVWYLKCMQQLFSDPSVTWKDFHFCAYGLKDPESGLRSLKPTSFMHCLPSEVMRPIFRRCKNFSSSVKHEHQPLEGNAGFTIKQVDILRKEMEAIDKEFNMTSSSLAVRIQDLPFNKHVQPLVIQDPLVQKFQKTMKQYPPETEIDIFKKDPNDWRCQNMWNGCKKLRQLCISSTQYDACTAYVHTIGINMPITSPPDDAIISFWQPDQLNRIWVLPASKCNWEKYDPKTWHAVMFSSVHESFTDAPAIRPMPIETDPWDPTDAPQQPDTQPPPDQPNHPMPDLRTRACQILLRILHISLIIPCRQHHAVCCQTVQWILHYRHTTSLADAALKRQKQSISSSSGLNRVGGDVSLPSQSQSSQPILPTVVVPSPPAILTNPEAEEQDEDLELPTLVQEETIGSPSKKQKTGKKKKKPDDNDESPEAFSQT